jgi:hypothetical protein
MAVGVHGVWDDDLYLDIVHFTEEQDKRMVGFMFRTLLQILAGHGLRCSTY